MSSPDCSWPVNVECCKASDIADFDPQIWADAQTQASTILWSLTARRFGDCRRIVRPCRSICQVGCGYGCGYGSSWGTWLRPMNLFGNWINVGCGIGCGDDCSCNPFLQKIELPAPCDSIEKVWQNGAEVPLSAFIVNDRRWLLRIDGGTMPFCQRMDAPLTSPADVPTFGVAYRWGQPVPLGGQIAAGRLACELAKACMGMPCQLPGKVTQVARDGVTMTLDPMLFLANGLTGIFEVDQWIKSVNPAAAARPSQTFAPGLRRPSAQTWPLPVPTPTPLP